MINPTVARMAEGGWRFTWDPGTGPYEVWLDGVLLDTVDDEEYEFVAFTNPDQELVPPALNIVDTGVTSSVAEGSLYTPFAILQWRGVQTAFAYLIQQYISGTWTTIQTLLESATGYYRWQSEGLDDVAVTQFRVKATDALGNADGAVLPFNIDVVRNPAPPDIVISIGTSGTVVVSGG